MGSWESHLQSLRLDSRELMLQRSGSSREIVIHTDRDVRKLDPSKRLAPFARKVSQIKFQMKQQLGLRFDESHCLTLNVFSPRWEKIDEFVSDVSSKSKTFYASSPMASQWWWISSVVVSKWAHLLFTIRIPSVEPCLLKILLLWLSTTESAFSGSSPSKTHVPATSGFGIRLWHCNGFKSTLPRSEEILVMWQFSGVALEEFVQIYWRWVDIQEVSCSRILQEETLLTLRSISQVHRNVWNCKLWHGYKIQWATIRDF